jgi:dTMP kinase
VSKRPLFIVLEGIDGSGTTTQGDLLAEALQRSDYVVHRTSEPSHGEVGQLIRRALQHRTESPLSAQAVALLFAADRIDHCEQEIGPALARGECVISDRYLASSLAFQVVDGEGGFDVEWIRTINRRIIEPDLSILIDVDLKTSARRIQARGKSRERFEVESFLGGVRERYHAIFEDPNAGIGRRVIIDGTRNQEMVAYDVVGAVMELLSDRDDSRSADA